MASDEFLLRSGLPLQCGQPEGTLSSELNQWIKVVLDNSRVFRESRQCRPLTDVASRSRDDRQIMLQAHLGYLGNTTDEC